MFAVPSEFCNRKPMNFFTVTSFFIALIVVAVAQEPSIAPPVDPIPDSVTIPKLYLSNAGPAPYSEMEITPFTQLDICPANYPKGFSIRCHVAFPQSSRRKTVFWRINDQLFKKEYYSPYYLAGDWRDGVGAFKGLESASRVRVTCRVLSRTPVWVDLVKLC